MLLDHLALETRCACFPRSQRTVTIREIVLDRPILPGHCTDKDWHKIDTPSIFLRKRPIFLSRSFGLMNRRLVWHTYRGLQRWSQGMEAGGCNLCILPGPYSSTLVSSIKELIPLFGALIFAAAARGHLYIAWLRWLAGLYVQISQDCEQRKNS